MSQSGSLSLFFVTVEERRNDTEKQQFKNIVSWAWLDKLSPGPSFLGQSLRDGMVEENGKDNQVHANYPLIAVCSCLLIETGFCLPPFFISNIGQAGGESLPEAAATKATLPRTC